MYLNPFSVRNMIHLEIQRCVGDPSRGTVASEGNGQVTQFNNGVTEGWTGALVGLAGSETEHLYDPDGRVMSRTYDHTNDSHGAVVEFDYLALDGSNALFKAGEYELNLEDAVNSGRSSGVSPDGIAWEIDGTQPTSVSGVDGQAISFNIYIPQSRMGTDAVDIAFDGQGARYGVDNWLIEDATENDIPIGLLDSDEKGALAGHFEKLTITDNPVASQDLPGTWDSLATKLALATGISGTIKQIDNEGKGQSFSALSDGELTDLANTAIEALEGWSSGDGFQDWTNKLWNSVDREYVEGNDAALLAGVGAVASSLFFIQNFAAGNIFATAGSTLLGIVNLVKVFEDQNPNIQLPDGAPNFEMTTVLAQLADELELRDINGTDGTGLGFELRDAVVEGYEAFGQFMVNSQAVSLISDLYANGEKSRVFADGEIDTEDFEEFAELGFDVDVSYREKIDIFSGSILSIDEYTIDLKSKDSTLYNGADDIRFVMDDFRNNDFDVVSFDFV